MKKVFAVLAIALGTLTVVSVIESPTAPTPTMSARLQAEEKRDASDQERAVSGAISLRKAMRNPESFKLKSAFIAKSGAVCYTYRAQNGFGGLNLEHAVLPIGQSFNRNDSAWNEQCAYQEIHDETVAVKVRTEGSVHTIVAGDAQ